MRCTTSLEQGTYGTGLVQYVEQMGASGDVARYHGQVSDMRSASETSAEYSRESPPAGVAYTEAMSMGDKGGMLCLVLAAMLQ